MAYAKVFTDHVQFDTGVGGSDLLQELEELLVQVTGVAGVGDLPVRGVEGGDQAGGAVPGVVVDLPRGDAGAHRQDRLAALKGLALALLINAHHGRVHGRVHVESDDPTDRGV